ncbi:unnamed protein product [Cyprideis torosa]|uniref:Glycerol-3-phosphate dehydrogenase n=1 Tax=Cyprideis torosa TaxID=163714 RepID=A0A7R8WS47_9CRUS|nr:unnamed protein product [Cyprideis torosa]CAG0904490.1 unnamed protein product [Cyprideis torosa]
MDYDLCVIGGGINGCGIARDAAGRGLKVLLVEAMDLASATSSCSTKLVHGGLRYLEHYEFRLVKESLREREILLKAGPHIVRPMDFVLPHDKNLRPYWMIKAGLFLYDFLAGKKTIKKSEAIEFATSALADPLDDEYERGFSYADCWVDDARLVVLNAMDAYERGAVIMPQTACMDLKPSSDQKSWKVNLQNMLNGDCFTISAKMVVNAAGPWVRSLLDNSNITAQENDFTPNVRLVKGSHIVVSKLYEGEQSFILQQPDGRIIFTIPYEGLYTLIGTTDVPYEDDPSIVHIDADEIDYLCAAVNRSLKQKITPEDVLWTYSGVRSLVDDGHEKASEITRDYKLYVDERQGPPIISVFGGKITTYRKLAEQVMERVSTFYPNKKLKAWTEKASLPGGDIEEESFDDFVVKQCEKYNFIPPYIIYRYARAYGTRMKAILGSAQSIEDLGVHYGDDVYEAEILYLIKYEFVHNLEDILWRRSKLGLHISAETFEKLQAEGDILSLHQKELTLFYPQKGWVEQDANDIWNDTKWAVEKVLEEGDVPEAIGITNQRETTILWDKKTGEPVYNAIVWQDRRTADYCAALKSQNLEKMVTEKTGLLLDPYFSATKIKWMLDNVDGARARAEVGEILFGTVDCFLLWNLTGGKVHATDASNAARTMVYNIIKGQWDKELLELFDIPEAMLPEVKDNCHDFGMADICGQQILIAGMAGDQQAASVGQACFEEGMVKSTYGTGCFALMNIGEEFKASKNKLLTTIAYQFDGQVTYAVEGSIFVAGAAIQWLRDNLEFFEDAKESEALANSVKDNNDVYFIPAFTGLGAPYWNPKAKAAITGLSRESTKAHITRAALEAQAFQTYDLMYAFKNDTGFEIKTLRIDGGLANNGFMCQFLADILNCIVEVPKITETTALGAAYLAGLQVGIYQNLDDISKKWQVSKRYKPNMTAEKRAAYLNRWRQEVDRVLLHN